MIVVPQQYRLYCVYSEFLKQFKWYCDNTELDYGSPQNKYTCTIWGVQILYSGNNTKFNEVTVTRYSGIFKSVRQWWWSYKY